MDTKQCIGPCGLVKPLTDFYARNARCKKCSTIHARNRTNTVPKYFFLRLFHNARSDSKKRKGVANECSLTLENIQGLHVTQQGLCYYSGIPYVLRTLSDWQCSLERIDPSQGYIPGNIALITCEFQSSSQWTTSKFHEFIRLLSMDHARQDATVWYPPKTSKPPQKTIVSEIDGVRYCVCKLCQKTKAMDNFPRQFETGCTECVARQYKLYSQTPYGHVSKMLKNMKNSTSNKARHRNIPPVALTILDLISIFEKQGGLCAYSGIPMTFGSYKDRHWTCSAERIDTTKGYSADNVCLICFEFNTPDRSSTAVSADVVTGASSWSKEKIERIRTLHCI
jgi:hypothetical protein